MNDVWQWSAASIANAVRTGEFTAEAVAQSHLDRQSAVNPAINAVVQDFPDEALESAREVDRQLAAGQDPGVLCGVPVTIKVNVDQMGHATTNGLRLLQDLIAEHDSPVVSNLRNAGAVIVGRTNTPAFSLRWFTNNALHGQTLNPRNSSLTPGGSSGGAAAAVAAGLCAVGHGTDIAGSVRYPAYACGLHGLRPSLGRVPAYNASGKDRFLSGQIMAVSGPIARTIEDIRLSLLAMMAPDPRDPWFTPSPLEQAPFEKRVALSVAPDGMPVAEPVIKALHDAAARLRDAGWTVDEIPCPPMRSAADVNAMLWMAETQFALSDMIEQEGEPDSQFVFREMTRLSEDTNFEHLMTALQFRVGLIREWDLFLQRYPVVLCPVSGELPFEQQLDVRSVEDFERVNEAQLTQRGIPALGLPALTVATGQVGQSPVGVQLIASRFREDILLSAGTAIEAAGSVPTVCNPDQLA